ncbi:MAG: translation initiation factor IF-2 [Candidatus Coproplasma sp.]
MAKNYENILNVAKLLSDGTINELSKKVSSAEKTTGEILKRLAELDNERIAKRAEEERIMRENATAEKTEKTEAVAEEVKEPVVKEEPIEKQTEKVEAVAQPAEKESKKQTEPLKEKAEVKEAVKETVKESVKETTPSAPANTVAPAVKETVKPVVKEEEKPAKPARPSFIVAKASSLPQKTYVNKETPARGERGQRPPYSQPRSGGAPVKPQTPKYVAPATAQPIKPNGKNFGPDKKKQNYEKTYVEKDRHAISKRALAKQQGVSVDDFDEDKSGYRKLRVKKAKVQNTQTIKIDHAVVTTNEIPLKVLSEKLGITAVEITKLLFKEGIMKTVNESIDFDTAALLAAGIGIELEYKPEKTAEEILSEKQEDTVEEIESLVPRAPVVTVMGHVDHGKTSLLDYIRKSSVTAGEAGGITQHIGAYSVSVKGKSITFIDTPGHEAFTAMRARGAMVTDIVILVVAADDGIMPQTIEAINHAKAAGVSIVVAINKMDKVGANPEKIKQDLTKYELVPEEWGGTTQVCPISCKTGEGIDSLLENVLLVAEMKELLANPAREARGVIIEAQLDKGKGPVATVLVQNGTLKTGDNIISGTVTGRVRAMIDDKGRTVKEAGPSMAVFVLGFEQVPNAGDSMFSVSQELIKSVLEERKRKEREEMVRDTSKVTLDDVFNKIAEGNMKTLNLIVKGDVQGSVEAVKQSVVKLSNEEVNVKVIHSGAGAINESDVMLAESSSAIILGFNVRPDAKARVLAERSKVDVRMYRIIYDLLDDVESALKGMRAPKYQDVYLGKCEVRQTFKITGVGNIAGCYVLEGKIVRGGKLRIYRDDVLVVEGNVQQLKRFKDDVKEVAKGYECGCAIEGFNDIRVGDIIECYSVEQIEEK